MAKGSNAATESKEIRKGSWQESDVACLPRVCLVSFGIRLKPRSQVESFLSVTLKLALIDKSPLNWPFIASNVRAFEHRFLTLSSVLPVRFRSCLELIWTILHPSTSTVASLPF